jgi:hypothetical protein
MDLLDIPARRVPLAPICPQTTLQEALETMQHSGAEAMHVERTIAPGINWVYDILDREQIESACL